MGFRFWRRIKILPGVTLNLSKSGVSFSFGVRGARFTISPGGNRISAGIPGTGIFYTEKLSNKKRGRNYNNSNEGNKLIEDHLKLNFFQRLSISNREKNLLYGLKELVLNNENKALEYLKQSIDLADGAFLAGFLSLKEGNFSNAIEYFKIALDKREKLGYYFRKYGLDVRYKLYITDEVFAYIFPDLEGLFLCMVEAYQRLQLWKEAIECLEKLLEIAPEDIIIKLSLVELLIDAYSDNKNVLERIVKIVNGIENESPIHTALLLYKAKALHKLGLFTAAKEVLTSILRRKKNRPEELLLAIRYERALVYMDMGQLKKAKEDFQKIYAEYPDYEDVAIRLKL